MSERLTDEQLYAMTVNLTPFKGHTPMSERMWLAEELEQARTQRDVLRVRVKELEEVIQTQNGVVVSGTLKLNEARARVAKLEAALKEIVEREPWKGRKSYSYDDAGLADYWSDMAKEFQEVARVALDDAPP
jgi:hypothetical protein